MTVGKEKQKERSPLDKAIEDRQVIDADTYAMQNVANSDQGSSTIKRKASTEHKPSLAKGERPELRLPLVSDYKGEDVPTVDATLNDVLSRLDQFEGKLDGYAERSLATELKFANVEKDLAETLSGFKDTFHKFDKEVTETFHGFNLTVQSLGSAIEANTAETGRLNKLMYWVLGAFGSIGIGVVIWAIISLLTGVSVP